MSPWKRACLLGALVLITSSFMIQYHPQFSELSKRYKVIIFSENGSHNVQELDGMTEKMLNLTLIQSQRISLLNRECQRHKPELLRGRYSPSRFHLFLMEPRTGLAYCHVPKVASSFWYSVFSTIIPGAPKNLPLSKLHSTMLKLSQPVPTLPDNAYKMIVVRHPFKRLVSAYVEKFVKTNETLFIKPLKEFMRKQHGHSKATDISFPNFINFVIHELQGNLHSHGTHHWIPYTSICRICETRIDFIGHLETLDEDVEFLIELFPRLKGFVPTKHNDVSHPLEYNRGLQNDENRTRAYLSQLDHETREDLLQIYKIDCQLFGYDCNKYWS